ncbi:MULTISPECIES: cytochrome o ubiquinol oxidase subunit III [Brevibacillus]|uniref:cytochrome o ubiquinol oxidase subunit III n=1 Tax=Brevibacillus TaxID=55080 RepID=UPI000D10E7D0|nr:MULTISPECIES: cytochrome o ubiquinol oxidase subunit III [Brevibacillus]PSJ67749.1 cytochrome o ubiquinol oxidase subunit III [Brevibacillus brevis]RED28310.1 cytochrome o ubiquinol oxidase subunit 3 [Brevibacillus brevis]TQK74253.1 cytochrome o ubiquinol oxidase subunit 3 [Brevibacillus sp. AG162]VEF91005.1 Cytochrome o ubiquinol oxidase subunit 3 [Brevibacillus brevis]GEC90596.1 cytochrome o ubiquinol oxidase subunit III [Brevibacillus brevis]
MATNHDHGHGHDHHEEHEQLKVLGFWIFVVTDCVLFGTLFATYAVMMNSFAGGPTGQELFQLPGVIASTFILLTSSFTSGLAVLAMNKGNVKQLIAWLAVTGLLGLSFVVLEVTEFMHLMSEGATMATSGYWSAFYTLVGTHGLHVTLGLFWMTALIMQLKRRGITAVTRRKITNLSLYWHFLDVVWIFLFTVVYLMGVM